MLVVHCFAPKFSWKRIVIYP